jgi:type I restriction enzyme S subunit
MREDWIECKADEFGELIRGITYDKSQAADTPKQNYLPILRANNINNNKLT